MLSTRYATREEAIECELVAALGTEAESVDDFDMERIADDLDSAIMRLGSGPGYARRLAIFRPDGSKVRESRWW